MIQNLEILARMARKNYFGDNKPIKKDVYRKRLAIRELSKDKNHTTLQGGCYIPTRDHFIAAIVNAGCTSAIVVEFGRDYQTVYKRVKMDIGHANDFTYNPHTNKIYVATGDTGKYAGRIAVLNGDTLKFESSIQLKDNLAKWLLSYDEVNKKYYVLDTSHLGIYNEDWELEKEFPNVLKSNYVGDCTMTAQASFCYDGEFITLYFSREKLTGSQRITGIYLQLVNLETGCVDSVARYVPKGNSDEPEFVAVIDDVAYMFGGQTYFTVSALYMDQTKIYEPDTEIMGTSILLDKNADLDECQLPGTYYSPDTAYTKGMKNVPVSTGFTLYVLPICGNVTVHKLIGTAGDIYKRVLSPTTNQFLDWELIDSSSGGQRFIREGQAKTHTVPLGESGSCIVFLPYGGDVNVYMISKSKGVVYARTITDSISKKVTVSKGSSSVSFTCQKPLGMIAWRMS